jgi:alkyl hydroperoxide reductase subunit F
MGHEFTSLVLALLQVGGYPPKVEQALLEQIRALDGDFEFEVYVSLTCHNCPDVVQALNLMAIQNPRIKTTMIEGGLFQDEIKEREIMGVPTVFLNGTFFGFRPHEPGRDPRQDRHLAAASARRRRSPPRTRSTC